MALFGKNKKKDEKVAEKTSEKKSSDKKTSVKKVIKKKPKQTALRRTTNKKSLQSGVVAKRDLTWVLKAPRITEKGAIIAESNSVYTFVVDKNANKIDVKRAIELIYKVKPLKIAIAKIPTKKVQVRGQRGKFGNKGGGKKAYVYLKKGDKIEFV
jgi:large subunit ribosomal protein L23